MKYLLLIAALVVGYTASAQPTNESNRKMEMNEKHLERVKAREARTADYVRFIDSLVLSHSFTFSPNSFQRQPAGMSRMIYNTNFTVGIYKNWVDVYLPYIKGITPPYYLSIINYTLPYIGNYVSVQNNDGWTVSFTSSLFSVNNYTFVFTIYSKTGEAILDLTSNIYNTVTYSGSIRAQY